MTIDRSPGWPGLMPGAVQPDDLVEDPIIMRALEPEVLALLVERSHSLIDEAWPSLWEAYGPRFPMFGPFTAAGQEACRACQVPLAG